MKTYRVVETCNFGKDYPDEKFATPYHFIDHADAQKVADILNGIFCRFDCSPRYWMVVDNDYQLKPGFEP